MDSLTERLARINVLRKQALKDPDFIEAAKEHEQAIVQSTHTSQSTTKKRKAKKKRERLSDIYSEVPEQQPIYY
ncbi:hypothetical protein [Vibrio sp. TBV020]|uniref:hypothetical protein n=1 Tax=Vibrio sp. TBV020 TaxID=3137398 RepID=UPI0038CD11F4